MQKTMNWAALVHFYKKEMTILGNFVICESEAFPPAVTPFADCLDGAGWHAAPEAACGFMAESSVRQDRGHSHTPRPCWLNWAFLV